MNKLPDHWVYTTCCECCKKHINYCVQKTLPYESFRKETLLTPVQSFKFCENCECQTLQTKIAFESQPE